MSFYFDSIKIIDDLNKTPDEKKLEFITSTLDKIDHYYAGTTSDRVPSEVKQLKLDLINYRSAYEKMGLNKNNSHQRLNESKKRKKVKTSNELIAEEVIKFWDGGMDVFKEIFDNLSKNSKNIFGEELTSGQIKGRYQRYSNDHKDYRREKY